MLFKNGIPAKTPKLLKYFFRNRIWNYTKGKQQVFLTFDDGPTPGVTDWVLDVLNQYNAKATFFCIGKNVQAHKELYNRILSEGHTLGNHTNNHLNGWKTKTTDYIKNVDKAAEEIDSNLFRPPYGKMGFKQAALLAKKGYKIIMWDVLAMDWDKNLTPDTCYQNVINNTEDGSIIVFHDSLKASKNLKAILPEILKNLKLKGFSFETII
ncbi:polysaccharide deacetylase family protein [Ascidiimonas sp. W6]|uniref:polysaccharide deacetylase family protein n=1 Tax=Ascidiimonas meishanensis TaxID=3128903 RepID=UPI0030EF3136